MAETISFQVVVEGQDAPGSLGVNLEHSGDGRFFDDVTGAALGTITIATSGTSRGTVFFKSSTQVLGNNVRLALRLTTTTRARVKVFATGRDS